MSAFPSVSDIAETAALLRNYIRRTPFISIDSTDLDPDGPPRDFVFKLELLQVTGTFKVRGALSVMLNLSPAERARGVTAVSSGNHAIAVSYAAKVLGISAKIVMLKTANPARRNLARHYGAEVEIAENGPTAFERVKEIEQQEGRIFVHPFEGPRTVAGTATLGAEWVQQVEDLDAAVIACGGGGLIAGVAAAIKQLSIATKVYGVEPTGADSMSRSFAAGEPITLPSVSTIADSLAPPMATPYTFGVCRRFVDQITLVTDDAIRAAMRTLFSTLKLGVEPAGAAALAAVLGPLRDELSGARRVGIMICGSNIDLDTLYSLCQGSR
jgi:threonine dehydratase